MSLSLSLTGVSSIDPGRMPDAWARFRTAGVRTSLHGYVVVPGPLASLRAPALPGWDPWNPVGIEGGTAPLQVTDGPWLACASPFGSADGPLRKREVRQCGQRHGGWDPCATVGSAGVTCLISTVDGSGRTPEIRECGQRHGPWASLPALKVSLQHFPRRTGRG